MQSQNHPIMHTSQPATTPVSIKPFTLPQGSVNSSELILAIATLIRAIAELIRALTLKKEARRNN